MARVRVGEVLLEGPRGRYVVVEAPNGRRLVLFLRRVGVSERRPARVSVKPFSAALREAFERVLEELGREKRVVVKVQQPRIGIPAWSLPSYVTCPGSTRFCLEYCYALKGQYAINPVVEEARVWNLVSMLLPGFVDEAVRVLEEAARRAAAKAKLPEPIVRLFDSGDIPDPVVLRERLKQLGVDVERLEELLGVRLDRLPRDYFARKIYEMVKRLNERGVRVYLYTRSWRVPHLREWVVRLARLPKTAVYLSVDYTMSDAEIEEAERLAKTHRNMGVAYTGFLPKSGEYYICPKELGTVNCAKCLVCPYVKVKRVVFPVH